MVVVNGSEKVTSLMVGDGRREKSLNKKTHVFIP